MPWVKLLAPYNDKTDTTLAKNSIDFQKQIAHYNSTKINITEGQIDLDFSETDQLGTIMDNDEITLKVSAGKALKFTSDQVKILSVANKIVNDTILHEITIHRSKLKQASLSFS